MAKLKLGVFGAGCGETMVRSIIDNTGAGCCLRQTQVVFG